MYVARVCINFGVPSDLNTHVKHFVSRFVNTFPIPYINIYMRRLREMIVFLCLNCVNEEISNENKNDRRFSSSLRNGTKSFNVSANVHLFSCHRLFETTYNVHVVRERMRGEDCEARIIQSIGFLACVLLYCIFGLDFVLK